MRSPTILTAFLAALLVLALSGTALANATDDKIVSDCQHSVTGEITGTYTHAQLRHALNNTPGDALEYSGCSDAIRNALLAPTNTSGGGGSGGSSGGGGGGGSSDGNGGLGATPGNGVAGTSANGTTGTAGTAGGGTAATAAPPATPPAGTKAPVQLGSVALEPGTLPKIGQDAHRLPSVVIVMLALLGGAALATALALIGRRVVARHGT